MSEPVLIDVGCGLGGATKGYQSAGFYVVGVDVAPQPDYCGDEFVQEDGECREAQGIDWSWDRAQLVEAIPPAYTEYVGLWLLEHVTAEEVAA